MARAKFSPHNRAVAQTDLIADPGPVTGMRRRGEQQGGKSRECNFAIESHFRFLVLGLPTARPAGMQAHHGSGRSRSVLRFLVLIDLAHDAPFRHAVSLVIFSNAESASFVRSTASV